MDEPRAPHVPDVFWCDCCNNAAAWELLHGVALCPACLPVHRRACRVCAEEQARAVLAVVDAIAGGLAELQRLMRLPERTRP